MTAKSGKISLLILGLSIVAASGAGIFLQHQQTEKSANRSAANTHTEVDNLFQNRIFEEDLKQKMQTGEDFYVLFYHPECPFCQRAAPLAFSASSSTGKTLYSVNINPELSKGLRIQGTPTIIHFQGGEESDRLEKLRSYEEYQAYFSK